MYCSVARHVSTHPASEICCSMFLLLNSGALGAVQPQSIDIEPYYMSLRCTGVSCPVGAAARGPDQRQQAPDSACSPDIRVLLVQLHASGPGDSCHRLHHTSGHIPGGRHAHHLIHPQGDLSLICLEK